MGCNHSSLVDDESLSSMDDSRSQHRHRIGILPYVTNDDVDSSSSDSGDGDEGIGIAPRTANNYGESSSSSSSSSSSESGNCLTGNQSIDDDGSRESVVDWLLTTQSNQSSYIDTMRSNMICNQPLVRPPTYLTNNDMRYPSKTILHSIADRRHVALPKAKPDGLLKGDFLSNRYVVNDYILLQKVGSGAHSEVRLSKHKATNALFAVKIIQKGRQQVVQQEIEILTKLSHQNVIKLYEVIDDARVDKVYLVLEFLQRGDLMRIVESGGPYNDDEEFRDIVNQILCGLSYLHDNNVLQNDLKPSNILLSDDGIVKIADFGISSISRIRRSVDHAGTPAYMAPEVVKGDALFDGRMADVYSLGATCFYLRFGRPPFVGRNVSELYFQIKTAKLSFPTGEDDCIDFISRLMEKDPCRRSCLKDALKHRWLCSTDSNLSTT